MSREDVIAVASRLFAIFLVISAVRLIGTAVQTEREVSGLDAGLVYHVLPIAVPYLMAAAGLWYFPLSIARKFLPVMRDSGPPISAAGADIAAIAFSVLGMWTLASAISDGVYWVVFVTASENGERFALTVGQKARIISLVVEAGIGVYLILGSRGLATILRKLRYGSGD